MFKKDWLIWIMIIIYDVINFVRFDFYCYIIVYKVKLKYGWFNGFKKVYF